MNLRIDVDSFEFYRDPRYSLKTDRFRKVGERVGEKLTENRQKIIDYMLQNKNVSAKELAELVGISQRKMETNISWLKEKGLIMRIGPAKGGHWEIVNG